jgi:hypothetical protein
MKSLSYFILLSTLISFTYQVELIYDLEKSSVVIVRDAFNEIILYDKTDNGYHITITKRLIRSEGIIKEQNYIKINDKKEATTNWEGIDSFFYLEKYKKLIVCPKGTNFMNIYNEKENNFETKRPNGFSHPDKDPDIWELRCFYQSGKNMIFNGFLNRETRTVFYGLYLDETFENWKIDLSLPKTFLDFIWTTEPLESSPKFHNMYTLFVSEKNGNLILENMMISIDPDMEGIFEYYVKDSKDAFLNKKNEIVRGYFNYDDNKFYIVSLTPFNEYFSCYSNEGISLQTQDVSSVSYTPSYESPLDYLFFSDKAELKSINFIRGTRFYYYEVEDEGVSYYGIVDIVENSVVFNTNQKLITFKPLTNYSMLAISEEAAYEVCVLKENGKCVESCKEGKIVYDNIKGNYCKKEEKPKCYEFCEVCTEYSDDIYDQKCIECKNGLLLIEDKGNCVFECDEGYYVMNRLCKKCHQNCKTCEVGPDIDEKGIENQNCDTCKPEWKYLILADDYPSNCVNECPEGMEVYEEYYCILKDEPESDTTESDSTESDSTESDSTESDSTESDSTESDSTESDSTESDSTESDSTESDSTESDSTESDSTESDSTESDSTESDSTESDSTESDSTESDSTESDSTKSDSTESDTTHSDTVDIDTKKTDTTTSQNNKETTEENETDYVLYVFIVLISIVFIIIAICIFKNYCKKGKSQEEILDDIKKTLKEGDNEILK